jgi:L-rhamnose mutarotase
MSDDERPEGARVQRFASVIRLKPEAEETYRRLHADVWPEVLDRLRACNVSNYTIFLRDGLLFSYLEYVGDDYAADMERMAADEATQRWWTYTDPCQNPLDTAGEGEWWAPAEELFHLD